MACPNCEWIFSEQSSPMRPAYDAYERKEYAVAFPLLLPFARAGEVAAICILGSFLINGIFDELARAEPRPLSEQIEEGRRLCESASARGCPLAWHNLGNYYRFDTEWHSADLDLARACYRRARELGLDVFGPDYGSTE